MKLQDTNLLVNEKNNVFMYLMYFAFIFSEYFIITPCKEALKVCEHIFFQEIGAESSVTCNLPVQLRFIEVDFDVLLSPVFAK